VALIAKPRAYRGLKSDSKSGFKGRFKGSEPLNRSVQGL